VRDPAANAVVNLVGLPLNDRPSFFAGLLPRLQELRAQFGRPHWIVVDEAHHLLPSGRETAHLTHTEDLGTAVLVTVHPNGIATATLAEIDVVIAVGSAPQETLKGLATAAGRPLPGGELPIPGQGEVTVWFPEGNEPPALVAVLPARLEHERQRRTYAAGDLGA
jgi:hypothetical protein